MDRNSYDSGDWFNLLDFSYQDNGWGRGLPPQHENEANWEEQQDFLSDPRITVGSEHISHAAALTREYIAIRRDEPLFRLRTAQDIHDNVRFHNTGTDQRIGLIAMSLGEDEASPELVVLFNTSTEALDFALYTDGTYELHPIQQSSVDVGIRAAQTKDGIFTAPARSAVVFKQR